MPRSRIAIGLCVASLTTAALVAVSSAATSTKYTAALSGAQEVPANGSKATGTATITVTGKRLCYVITSKNLGAVPQMGHIHKGNKGKSGAVFVTLFAKATPLKSGKLSGCVTPTAAQLRAIAAKPGAYYANVHTKKYPAGAMRGQLRKS